MSFSGRDIVAARGDISSFSQLKSKSNKSFMKTITCKAMGGPCDAAISADTVEEMMEKGKAHVGGSDDEGHKELVAQMEGMSEEELAGWIGKVKEQFENAPDAE